MPRAAEEGHRVVLVNSNPATIMTDPEIADAVYLEPLTVASVEEIIARERPDALLPTLGGQTGLNLAVELAEAGVLERYGVELLGTPIDTIRLAEDRERFKHKMIEIGEPVPESAIVTEIDAGPRVCAARGLPAGRAARLHAGRHRRRHRLRRGASCAPRSTPASPPASSIKSLLETSLLGWKEIEYEVLRDGADNCIVVCNMENIDPVGVHTGDSIVVAPSQTLSDIEYQMLRSASLNVIRALDVQGGCNIQFALHPHRMRVRDHRGQPARLAQLGASLESDRLSDRQDLDAHRARPAARRNSQPRHRRHQSRLRADARLRGRQDSALAV